MFLTKEQYVKAKDLYDKKVAPSPLVSDLAAWAGENFEVTVIDYIDALKQKCINIIKKYDNYGLWENGLSCEFCSQQTFLEKYKGNWQYYYQR